MKTLRPSNERGYADHGWLQSYHSFSFANYDDPAHRSFGNLRVINEDFIAPGTGFGTHGHKDMEIITYVLSGSLGHKDSMGNGTTIKPGDVQRMSAGKGVMHSEFNHEKELPTHLLQIWIEPNVRGISPSYEQTTFSELDKRGNLKLIASPDGAQGSVTIHADAKLYAGLFDEKDFFQSPLNQDRRTYIHLVRGEIEVNGVLLKTGDAIKLEAEDDLQIRARSQSEVLVFDLT